MDFGQDKFQVMLVDDMGDIPGVDLRQVVKDMFEDYPDINVYFERIKPMWERLARVKEIGKISKLDMNNPEDMQVLRFMGFADVFLFDGTYNEGVSVQQLREKLIDVLPAYKDRTAVLVGQDVRKNVEKTEADVVYENKFDAIYKFAMEKYKEFQFPEVEVDTDKSFSTLTPKQKEDMQYSLKLERIDPMIMKNKERLSFLLGRRASPSIMRDGD
ncbi:MAG: hypothetical protein FWE31_02800 [Firmicutes bacterium]|nr:hypothetical protein [Bacillota bacterium]